MKYWVDEEDTFWFEHKGELNWKFLKYDKSAILLAMILLHIKVISNIAISYQIF